MDKYVGDAMVMFFGDPDSRGVKEDALACVMMALAMQHRMGSSQQPGGTPVSKRHCAAVSGYRLLHGGNFGSEDRMDYTIIGGAVNLAARLEQERPGTIVISHETFAQVKCEIECEELGHVHVKGISYPVATYRVVDLKSNLAARQVPIRTELPHFRIEAEPELMSAEDRDEAAQALRSALVSDLRLWRRREVV
jgi:adenylate cyclase